MVDLGPVAEGVSAGDSICVAGACLTAVAPSGTEASFDAVEETLARTTLGKRKPGDRVNLERSVRAGDRLDGHIVQGHVDGVAGVARVDEIENAWMVHFECADQLTHEMVHKGSVALDGVSLTLAAVGEGTFQVALIPTTLDLTTLSNLKPGDAVNVETDVLGKYVLKLARRMFADGDAPPPSSALTKDFLAQHGFA